MITVKIDVEGMRLTVEGHANYAPLGQDIICSAASMLAYTLAQNLALTLYPDDFIAEFDDEGRAYIEAHPPDDLVDRCQFVFMTIANGFALLEAQYGQYIQLEGD